MSDFRRRIEEYIGREARPVDKFGHQPRLYALTLRIGADLAYDDDVVFAAAWLHDLGVFSGHRPEDPATLASWDNVAYAIEQAPSVLREAGFPAEKIAATVEAIRTHQPAAHPATIEATILRDADILEQLGAIGIMRAVSKIGRDTRYPDFTPAAQMLRMALKTLPDQLHLDAARELAKAKIEVLARFLAGLEDEANPALY
jgi:uncharacterized protein